MWAELYRLAMAEPDGVYSLGVDEDGFSLGQIDAKDPATLVRLLENFAHYGTFKNRRLKVDLMFERMGLHAEFQALLKKGNTKDEALELLSEKHSMRGRGYSRSNIERKLGLRK
jgi:hypothetical protein